MLPDEYCVYIEISVVPILLAGQCICYYNRDINLKLRIENTSLGYKNDADRT